MRGGGLTHGLVAISRLVNWPYNKANGFQHVCGKTLTKKNNLYHIALQGYTDWII